MLVAPQRFCKICENICSTGFYIVSIQALYKLYTRLKADSLQTSIHQNLRPAQSYLTTVRRPRYPLGAFHESIAVGTIVRYPAREVARLVEDDAVRAGRTFTIGCQRRNDLGDA